MEMHPKAAIDSFKTRAGRRYSSESTSAKYWNNNDIQKEVSL